MLPWSRWRFVRLARDQKATMTMWLLAECFEEAGGVPAVVLADRLGCLRGGVVANVVVPTADYVRFATHYGFRLREPPDGLGALRGGHAATPAACP